MKLGQAIKLVRTSAGFKQHKLASKLGVSSNYISLIECGKREPSVPFLRHLAKELRVPVGVFFLWQDFDPGAISHKNLGVLRDLLLRIEAMYLGSTIRKAHRRPRPL
jgi:transcriptional regulator with XRE-family HTH domain